MATTKAQQRAVDKYVKANYDRIELKTPKGRKAEIKAHAETHGESVNGFIGRAIAEAMERDAATPTTPPMATVAPLPDPPEAQAANWSRTEKTAHEH